MLISRRFERKIMDKYITMPITEETTAELKAGDYVYLTGTMYVARDAAHKRMIEALDEPLRDLMSALHRMIERTPPELASDIFDEGITLSGGGAQLFGLDGVISDQLKIRTTLADEPDLCVAHGLSELIDDEDKYENIDLVSGSRSDLLEDE